MMDGCGSTGSHMNRRWHIVISLALTLAIGYLVYRSVPDWGQAWKVMLGGRPGWLMGGLGFVMLHMVLRSLRWGVLLTPLKTGISAKSLFSLTLIKYVVNVIPPRVGEVAASVVLARQEKISAVSVIGTSVFERLLDMLTVLVLFGFYLVFLAQRHVPNSERGEEILRAVREYSVYGLLGLGSGLAVLLLMLRSRRWHGWIPGLMRRYVLSFVEGFHVLHSRMAAAKVILLSVAIWLAISAQLWSLSRAYLEGFPFSGSLLIMALTVVGVAIPTPGGVGGFQFFMNISLVHFFSGYLSSADPYSQAAGISNGCYIVSMLPVMAFGSILLNREGLSLGGVARLSQVEDRPG